MDKRKYLIDRIKEVDPTSNKTEKVGALILRHVPDYEDKIDNYLIAARKILVSQFRRITEDTPEGAVKLTLVSSIIGRVIMSTITDERMGKRKEIGLGDFILEAFIKSDEIYVSRDAGFSKLASSAPYVVEATEKFKENYEQAKVTILDATTPNRIPKIRDAIQEHGRTVIKNWDENKVFGDSTLGERFRTCVDAEATWVTAVDNLQSTGWKINSPALDIVLLEKDKLRDPNEGKRLGVGSKMSVNDAREKYKGDPSQENMDAYNEVVGLWNKELVVLRANSKNAELDEIIALATALRGWTKFYQYVELDYRGRAYYQEPFMNYQGTDLARGLMLFSEGKKIDTAGFKWLAIHTASCYNQAYEKDSIPTWCATDYKSLLEEQGLESVSVDKMTLKDRFEWTMVNMEKILKDSTQLVECEKMFSYLSACIEWRNYLQDPEGHLSYLPIPIDGTCNGYQHSAAISKDEVTGELVSLMDTAVPHDLYVKGAQAMVAKDPTWFAARPDMKMKHIRKGISKRGIMTRAYSAGKNKIADSMYSDCYTEGYTDDFNISMIDCEVLASNLVDSLADVCPGATKTMKYLQELAAFEIGTFETFDAAGKKVSIQRKKKMHGKKMNLRKVENPDDETLQQLNDVIEEINKWTTRLTVGNGKTTMRWMTPSQFPVLYENFIQKPDKFENTISGAVGGRKSEVTEDHPDAIFERRYIKEYTMTPKVGATYVQKLEVHENTEGGYWEERYFRYTGRIKHVIQEDTPYPSKQGFAAGVSPNFIHSMDAAHMAGVIEAWDGAFGAVHDSFSTHACDVDKLSEITREIFVDIYDVENAFEDIKELILSEAEECNVSVPELGTLDIKGVLESKYFFC